MNADFAMAIHFHQPTGNFDHVIDRASDKCYVPFLETLRKYPDIKMSLHFTGCLLEWAENKRPEIVDMIRQMAEAGQIEIISGGFYEPILSSIPERDQVRQIKMLTEYIKAKLSYDPQGAWIAERVWEPNLPSVLNDAGIKYVILDDTHLLYSGITKDKTYGHYFTEDNARGVAVFPSDKVLRYQIPYKMPEECTGYMKGILEKINNPVFIYGDDGEKFGEWPGTHDWVYKEKWLEKFFDELMGNADWLKTVKFSELLKKNKPLGQVYLATTSYEEMLEWALPAESQEQLENVMKDIGSSGKYEFYKPFIRGGFWRNFLTKYPESNHMHKKMIYVSKKVESLRKNRKYVSIIAKAEKELMRGQCNCAYWHGVFGGLYLFHLRNAVYHHLIKSEALMDKINYGSKQFCEAKIVDIDGDGFDEVVMENRNLSLYFDPSEGGVLKELDSKTECCNLINSLARRKEAYHRKIQEKIEQRSFDEASSGVQTIHEGAQQIEAGIKDELHYDRYGRYGLVDHFFDTDVDIKTFSRYDHTEIGNFGNGRYNFKVKKPAGGVTLVLEREGTLGGAAIHLRKEVHLRADKSAFTVRYSIVNRSDEIVEVVFAPEFNWTMPDADSPRYSVTLDGGEKRCRLNDSVQFDEVKKIGIIDERKKMSILMAFTEKCRLWHFPVKTVSQSEKAYELKYQSSALVPRVDINLNAGKEKRFEINILIDSC